MKFDILVSFTFRCVQAVRVKVVAVSSPHRQLSLLFVKPQEYWRRSRTGIALVASREVRASKEIGYFSLLYFQIS